MHLAFGLIHDLKTKRSTHKLIRISNTSQKSVRKVYVVDSPPLITTAFSKSTGNINIKSQSSYVC